MNGTPPACIQTERLTLRVPTTDDAATIFERWAQDRDVVRYLTWRPHASIRDTESFLRDCGVWWKSKESFTWVIALRGTIDPIGMLSLRPGAHGHAVGYVLAKAFWNRGYMTEALRSIIAWELAQPECSRIWAVCDLENLPSARVLEKSGLQREGLLRRWNVHPNVGVKPRDCFCYSIVK